MSSSADEIFIASPFCFADFTPFIQQIANHRTIRRIILMTTLKESEIFSKTQSLQSLNSAAIKYNIDTKIIIDNALHGKIYIFKSNGVPINAVITSANLTHNGLLRNHEWGCHFDDMESITKIEQDISSITNRYELTNDMVYEIQQRITEYENTNPITESTSAPQININDIVFRHRFCISISSDTRIFLKPIGTAEQGVYDGDYSAESEQYFAKRPTAVRKDDIIISYAVGARKIISAFKVLSTLPFYTENDQDRWPWYVETENMTPKFGKIWHTKELYIRDIVQEYIETFDLNITHNGGKTLGALQRGADKIRLDQDFGTYLLSKILNIEQNL